MQPVAIPAGRRPDNDDEQALVAALRRGEEAAFVELVARHGASLLRLARTFVRDRAVAEEVVQETWLAVLNGIDRFEGRSSLKTWIFQILSNRAKTRAVRERRSAPFSALAGDGEDDEAAVDADRFRDESASLGRPLGGRAGRLERAARGAPARQRDAHPGPRRDRDAAAAPGRGARPARRRGLGLPRRSAPRSASATETSASCCTARAARCAPPWSAISTRE